MTRNVLFVRLAAACVVLLMLHALMGALTSPGPAPIIGGATRTASQKSGANERADRPSVVAPAEAAMPSGAGAGGKGIRVAAADNVAASATAVARLGDLGTAERLSIRFQGLPDLSGDYRIGSDNMVSIPVVGRIALEGLSAADLEKTLSQRTSSISGREAFVTVEIAEHKPVFVTGMVQKPGTAPWKPGMTVLHALTIAGSAAGARAEQQTGSTTSTMVSPEIEQFRLRRSVLEQKRNLATMARLTSERNGSAIIELPEKLVFLVGPREAQALIDEQAALMLSRNQSVENQRAALERAIANARQELNALQLQQSNVRSQLDLRRSQKEKLEGLATKGWTRTDRVLDEQIRIIDLEEKAINISVATARVQLTLTTLERDRAKLNDERRAQIDTDMLKLERDIAQVDVDIEQARFNFRMATGTEIDLTTAAQSSLARASTAPAFEYSIVRQHHAGLETIKADQFTRVNPGDIVVVGMR